jgi:hypothetical protein
MRVRDLSQRMRGGHCSQLTARAFSTRMCSNRPAVLGLGCGGGPAGQQRRSCGDRVHESVCRVLADSERSATARPITHAR